MTRVLPHCAVENKDIGSPSQPSRQPAMTSTTAPLRAFALPLRLGLPEANSPPVVASRATISDDFCIASQATSHRDRPGHCFAERSQRAQRCCMVQATPSCRKPSRMMPKTPSSARTCRHFSPERRRSSPYKSMSFEVAPNKRYSGGLSYLVTV